MLGIISSKVSTTIYIGVVVTWFLTKAQRSHNATTAIKMSTRFLIEFFLSLLSASFISKRICVTSATYCMYTICYIVFFVLSTAAAFKNDKGNQMHFTDNQTRYTLPLLLRLVHTTKMQKAGHSFCYVLLFWRRVRDSAHFVRPRVCSANYPIIDFFWQDFVLQKIVRVRIPCCLINKK